MKRSDTHHSTTRRDFLKGLAATGGATALLAANAAPLIEPGSPLTPVQTDDGHGQGYRLTRHIRDYYQTLR
ncbi:MAG TPA: twin-arginine translocation signal domain-containing protein [Gammaproteobacteria bacterium]|nr:twin-arginine translocation signal domain-containing protein [Gammaproteobacteria bacterium]